jgi:hypothetical protein
VGALIAPLKRIDMKEEHNSEGSLQKTLESTNSKKMDHKKKIKYMRDRDREKVKGIFHYHERPGGFVTFNYYAHAGDPVEKYTLHDGHDYEIPRGVARHFKENCRKPHYEWAKNERGDDIMILKSYRARASFESMDFFELEDIKPDKQQVIQVLPG